MEETKNAVSGKSEKLVPGTKFIDRGDGFPTWDSFIEGLTPEQVEMFERQREAYHKQHLHNALVEEFNKKSIFLESDELLFGYDESFQMREIDVETFFDRIFDRTWMDDKQHPDAYEFEGIGCKEYLDWRDQKNQGVEDIDYSQYSMWRYNPIVLYTDTKKDTDETKNKHRLVLKDDPEVFDFIKGRKFAISSPITYVGRSRFAKNARYLFAFAIDLDGVGLSQLRDVFYQQWNGLTPTANIVVNSGHGLHLYYILEKPIPLYRENVGLLQDLKTVLTGLVWNFATSTQEKIQVQGVFQGFRLPGTMTKFGEPIRAFENVNASYFTIAKLNEFTKKSTGEKTLSPEQIEQLEGGKRTPSQYTLKGASEQFPEWYEKVILNGEKSPKKWKIKRDLYDWWLSRLQDIRIKDPKLQDSVTVGHRYFCILTLAIYAQKCDVSLEELRTDAFSLLEHFDRFTDDEDNHFTEQDIEDALKGYRLEYNTFPRNSIQYLTAMKMPVNRRNGRKQEVHVKLMTHMRDTFFFPEGGWQGRKKGSKVTAAHSKAAKMVKLWKKMNPKGSKSQCAKDTGLSRPTVTKWWGKEFSPQQEVFKWRMLHLDNENKSQCAKDTGLDRKTVAKYWNYTKY